MIILYIADKIKTYIHFGMDKNAKYVNKVVNVIHQ